MMEAFRQSSMGLRMAWALRLLCLGSPRRRLGMLLGCLAFSLATLAILVGLTSLTAGAAARVGAGDSLGTVQLVAFLRDDLQPGSRDALSLALGQLPGVERVRLLGSDQALQQMRRDLGDQASVLDGVEEGFLPASLEISLHTGRQGADRADEIAWRLRRMEGITDVDVRRTTGDERLARVEIAGRRSGELGLALAVLATSLALGLAAVALRRPLADGRLLLGLGFTPAEIATPGALAGGACALAGAVIGTSLGSLGARLGLVAAWWPAPGPLGPLPGRDLVMNLSMILPTTSPGGVRGLIAGSVLMMAAWGAGLGWWMARPGELDEVEA